MSADNTRPFTVIKQPEIVYPNLWLEVWVEGDKTEQRAFAEMFVQASCTKASSPEKADLVIFTGGSDVNPELYGEKPHKTTQWDLARDARDIEVYKACHGLGIPMFGVCRGAQFGWVMNGGKLYQDVDNHYGDHTILDLRTNTLIDSVSSVHHQMCMEDKTLGADILADAVTSTERWLSPSVIETGHNRDIEAFFFRDTCFFGVQGHPEYRNYHEYMKWCLDQIEKLVLHNPDTTTIGNNIRLKQEILDTRKVMA